jgi:phage shock protein A
MLEVIEARVPQRAVRLEPVAAQSESRQSGFAPVSGFFGMGLFGRLGEIMTANVGAMLDRAEDPARMIRMIILELEETLVDVRASVARAIADSKEIGAAMRRLNTLAVDWSDKAELAIARDRDDLARAALLERQKAVALAASLEQEHAVIETTCRAYDADIAKLQAKLGEARGRQHTIATRFEGAVTRARAAAMLNGARTAEAFAQFERLERHVDLAEGKAEALGLCGGDDELAERKAAETVDAELAAMKTALRRHLN